MNSYIKVKYTVSNTAWHINEKLIYLADKPLLSLDTETKGVYSKEQRSEALRLLEEELSITNRKLTSMVASNSGLSFPSLINVTHFIFGTSECTSVVLVTMNPREEIAVWNWVKNFKGKLVIHNTLFDLKIMYHRIKALPQNYEDTALLAKTLLNNAEVWKAKIDLKELMGSYYDPAWSIFNEYEPDNPKNRNFLNYAAIDGAATFKLYQLLLEEIK